jgi:hypothetical protein
MSTRGHIARVIGGVAPIQTWKGRYHHMDSYPAGLGARLLELHREHFHGDLAAMLKVLLDDHPAGWSTIVWVARRLHRPHEILTDTRCNFNLKPGFLDYLNETENEAEYLRPRCYCHGDRAEEPRLVTPENHGDAQYAYVFDEQKMTLDVYQHRLPENDWQWLATFDLLADYEDNVDHMMKLKTEG